MRSEQKRIPWIDCAKGITMLLVIMGHVVGKQWSGSVLRAVIFSFHMPLFFILSGYTFTPSKDRSIFLCRTKKAAVHLLLPVLIVTLISAAWNFYIHPNLMTAPWFWRNMLYRLIGGSPTSKEIGGLFVESIGALWFLYVLFFGRTIYDGLQMTFDAGRCLFLVWVISLIGVLLGISDAALPFSLDIALAVLPFFWVGTQMKRFQPERNPFQLLLVFGAVWLLSLWILFPDHRFATYLELALKRYPFFPLCYLCAAAGTLFMCELSYLICRIPFVSFPFVWIGKNSLYLLCIHQLDVYWEHKWTAENQFICSAKRIIVDVMILVVFVLAKEAVTKVLAHMKKSEIRP